MEPRTTAAFKDCALWSWPWRPLAVVFYLLKSWEPLGTRFLFLVIAALIYVFFPPDIVAAQRVSLDWIGSILLRNIVLLTVVAGGLHVVLWGKKLQGDEYKYFLRPLGRNICAFFLKTKC